METIWADWKIVRLLGEGSFGKVYEVVRNRFGIEERSAVKVISIPSSPSEANSLKSEGMTENDITAYYKGVVQDFVQEIAVMSKLRGHINIVSYDDYEVVEHTDRFGWDIYIRMELLTPLSSRMVDGSMSEQDVTLMAIDMCSALEACADHHIVHRDIKPDNIFVSKTGEYKLGDFGVAKTIDKTVSGLSKKGTYTYMAPEIYKGEPGGLNSDLYSLGIVLYRLLNDGREPFAPPAPQPVSYAQKQEALARRMRGDYMPPPAHASNEMFAIIQKACAMNPAERYQNPTQMRADLRELISLSAARGNAKAAEDRANPPQPQIINIGDPAPEVPQTLPQQPDPRQFYTQPKKKRSKAPIVIIIVIVLLLLGGLAGGAFYLYNEGYFDEFLYGSSDSTEENEKDKKEEEAATEDDASTKLKAIDNYALFFYDTTASIVEDSLPLAAEEYLSSQYGITIDDAFADEINAYINPDNNPVQSLTLVESTSYEPSSYDKELLEFFNLNPDEATFFTVTVDYTFADGTNYDGDFDAYEYNGNYYSIDALKQIKNTIES